MSGNDGADEGPDDDRNRSGDDRTGPDPDAEPAPEPSTPEERTDADHTAADETGSSRSAPTDGSDSDHSVPADETGSGRSAPTDGSDSDHSVPTDETATGTTADDAAVGRPTADDPAPERGTTAAGDDDRGPVRWFLTTDREDVAAVRDLVSTVAGVLLIGVLLFAISGIWPPLVAVESGSMEPHMYRGDLVFIVDEHRFSGGEAVAGTGVVTWRTGQETGYWSFGNYGNVIVFEPDGSDGTPIIHRARFWVEEGENWIDSPGEAGTDGTGKANLSYLSGGDDCSDYNDQVCPAPHDGFITKGDANGRYDQVVGRSEPVKPEWIRGTAKVRVPYLGWVRLTFSGR